MYESLIRKVWPPGFVAAFLLSLLVFAPHVVAQTPTSVPLPTSSSAELQLLAQLAQRMETMSASDSSTVNAATLFMAASYFVLMVVVLLLAVWIARGGLGKFFEAINTERKGRQDAEKERDAAREEAEQEVAALHTEQARLQERQAQSLDHIAASQLRMVEMFETKDEADTSRRNAVTTINEHTDDALKPLDGKLTDAIAALEELKRTSVTNDQFKGAMDDVLRMLRELQADEAHPCRDASKVPATDPAAPAPASSPNPSGAPKEG